MYRYRWNLYKEHIKWEILAYLNYAWFHIDVMLTTFKLYLFPAYITISIKLKIVYIRPTPEPQTWENSHSPCVYVTFIRTPSARYLHTQNPLKPNTLQQQCRCALFLKKIKYIVNSIGILYNFQEDCIFISYSRLQP